MIGSLLHVSNKSRPHIAFVVGRLNRYTSNPANEHWTESLDILERHWIII